MRYMCLEEVPGDRRRKILRMKVRPERMGMRKKLSREGSKPACGRRWLRSRGPPKLGDSIRIVDLGLEGGKRPESKN